MKHCYIILFALSFFACSEAPLFSEEARHDFWLLHEGADLPIVVEGNTQSKVFLIFLHGGPGGTAQDLNAGAKPFTDPLEEDYALVYYDQRNAGIARGEWDEEKLSIEQHIEDLDQVIDLMFHHYGSDIKIFLAGLSWGGYLGTGYLLDPAKQAKITAWINISGQTHRNLRNHHNLTQALSIAEQQIAAQSNTEKWSTLADDLQIEIGNNIQQYDAVSERVVNNLKARAERLIDQNGLLDYNTSSVRPSIFSDNYDPLLILSNQRKGTLIEQMYTFDLRVETELTNIALPVLCLYGNYDVTTAYQQGAYLLDNISTAEENKQMILFSRSGHSSIKNEPVTIAQEIKQWIEKYR